MWQSGKMKKLRRILAGWLCVILVVSLNISSLAEKGGQITEIIPTLSSEDKAETKAPSEESDEIPDETETMPIETDPAGEPEEENKNTSSVILHTPSNTENTEQTGESDTSGDPEDEATPSDADEDLINDLIDDEATPSDATPADADLVWSVEELQKRIDALPAVSELEGEELGDFLLEVYREVVDIREAVESLSEDEQALLDVGKLEELETFFVEEYPAVFAAESGVLVDTGIMNKTLRWSVYETSEPGATNQEYTVIYTWETDAREGIIGPDKGADGYLEDYKYRITKAIFPEDGEIILDYQAIRDWAGIREIEFPDSIIEFRKKAIASGYSFAKLQRLILPGSITIQDDAIDDEAVRKLNKLIFTNDNPEKAGKIGARVFRNTNIEELEFPGAVKEIGEETFFSNRFLNKLDLGQVETIGAKAFADCIALKQIEIPTTITTIGSKAFSGCSIERLVYRAADDAGLVTDSIELPEQSEMVIGKETKHLTGSLFNGLKRVSVFFEPNNAIGISGITDGPVKALNGLSGTYYVDEVGVLYTEDKKTLIYCPPEIAVYTVPETVTQVGAYAFCQAKDLTEVTFAAPKTVTEFGTRAFYGCTRLARINTRTTIAEVKEEFSNCKVWDSQLFMNTALTDAPQTGGILQKEKIELREGGEDAILSFGFSMGVTTTETETGFENLTGDSIHLQIDAHGTNEKMYQYRIYMEASDPACSFGIDVDQTLELGPEGSTIPVTLRESDVEGIYYLEFSLETGSTASFEITPAYPSPDSAGGILTVWGAILTAEEADVIGNGLTQDGDAAQQTEWGTVRNTFAVEKKATGMALQNGLALRGDGTEGGPLHVVVNGGDAAIGYDLNLVVQSGSGSQDTAYGKDFVHTVHYRDTLMLPDGMHWKQEVLDAIQSGAWYAEFDKNNDNYLNFYYKNNNVVYLIAQIKGNAYINTAAYKLEVSDENVILSWNWLNGSTKQEISTKTISLLINTQNLRVSRDDPAYGWGENQTLTNHISCTLQYMYSGDVTIETSVELPIAPAKSEITIKKTSMGQRYRGAEAYFNIALANKGGLTFNGLKALEDTNIPKDYYIRPEDIVRMFRSESFGKHMQLTITDATLYQKLELETATALDGITPVTVTAANSSLGEEIKAGDKPVRATMVFAWEGNELNLKIYHNGNTEDSPDNVYPLSLTDEGVSIQAALDAAGYLVTYHASYHVVWNLDGIPLYAGQTLEFPVYTTLKDTFQFIQEPWHHEEDVNKANRSGANIAKVIYLENGAEKYLTSTYEGSAYADFRIDKSAAVKGTTILDDMVLAMGDNIEYTLNVRHWGKGDTNGLPLIDFLTGPQQLLVPVERNQESEWAKDLTPEEIEGSKYYILTTDGGADGEYKNVWIGTDENGTLLCADTVKLQRTDGQLKTTITWYYHNLTPEDYTHTVTYKVHLKALEEDKTEGSLYWINNIVWLNGKVADYLYDHTGLYVTEFKFGKEIVVSPEGEPEQTAIHSVIKKGSSARYKLSLDMYSNVTADIKVTDAYDVLPFTHGKFNWTKDNVKIRYTDRNGAPIDKEFVWDIVNTDSTGKISKTAEENTYFTIQWGELTIPLESLVIYVELQFPENAAVWDPYVTVNAGKLLYNDFYIGGIQRRVSHELAETGRIYLQKGVYRIGHYSGRSGNYDFYGTTTRTHYINEDGNQPKVAYYIQLYNGGNTRLYLTEIQDELPKGFTLADDRSYIGYLFSDPYDFYNGYNGGNNYVVTDYRAYIPYKDRVFGVLTDTNNASITYKSARVTVQTQENTLTGRQKLTFTFGKGSGYPQNASVNYDPDRNLYFLEKGEAISFAYTCRVGEATETEDYAENAIAMPYLDYSGGGIDAAKGVTGRTYDYSDDPSGVMTETMDKNIGLCDIISNDEALSEGFSIPDSDESQEWLRSSVTVERGGIIPGITKKASSYTTPESTELPYSNGAGPLDQINWTLTLHNNGEVPLIDYTVKDTMEYPYIFTGDVKYTSYTMTGKEWTKPEKQGTLFSITDRILEAEQTYLQVTDGSKTYKILLAESEENAQWTELSTTLETHVYGKFQLRFYKEGNREIMEIHMSDPRYQLLSGGYAELAVSTVNKTNERPYKIYTNHVVQKPTQIYEADRVTQGMNVTDETGKNAGVRNSAPVVIAGAYATSSYKAVEEKDMPEGETNRTDSSGLINYILLPGKNKEFTYTLTVNNDNTGKYSIGNMTFIDNLPEVGDHATFSADSYRESQFKVRPADDPNVTVRIEYPDGKQTELDLTQYTVEYTNRTEFEEADWEGNGSGWSETVNENTRSLRIMILPVTDKEFIPEQAKIHVSFNARIDGDANAGDIAWNSFGYRYSMIGETPKLLSAPLKVGVKIPEIPILEKRLISVEYEESPARQDQTFHFLIHQGPVLDGLDYNDEDAVKTALSGSSAPAFTVVPVTVKSGDTSGQVVLSGLKQWKAQTQPDGTIEWVEDTATDWNWTDRTQYTIAELTPSADYQFFRLHGSTTNGVSFYHQDATPIRLDCENRYPGWSILLKKADSKIVTTLLPGAVFALYSPLASDQIQEGDAAYDAYLALSESERPAMTFAEPGTSIGTEGIGDTGNAGGTGDTGSTDTTWYLADIRTTGDSGTITWEGLSESAYRLKEVRAPEGYQITDTGYLEAVKPDRQEGNTDPLVLTITVKNTSAFVLPKTGGTGTLPVNLAGILCLCYSGFLYKKKRAGVFTQKEKGGKGK